MTTFTANVHQNAYLPRGEAIVHAIVAFAVEEVDRGPANGRLGADAVEVLMLDCSASMASPATKLDGARTATCKAIDKLRDGTWFAIVAGTSFARLVYPPQRYEQGSSSFRPRLAPGPHAPREAGHE